MKIDLSKGESTAMIRVSFSTNIGSICSFYTGWIRKDTDLSSNRSLLLYSGSSEAPITIQTKHVEEFEVLEDPIYISQL